MTRRTRRRRRSTSLMPRSRCVKCGCVLTKKTRIDWDISGSVRRFICPECAEEEGILPEEEE